MPSAFNTSAEIRELEPYVYNQFINSKYSPRYGAARLPWLTGTASWAYYTVTQYILGIQPDYAGLRIDPCIPPKWKEIKISRIFRKKNLHFIIKNPNGVEKGIKKIVINSEELPGNIIPLEKMKEHNQVLVLMG